MVRRTLYLIASVGKLLPLLVDEGPAEVGDVGKMLEALLEKLMALHSGLSPSWWSSGHLS